MSQASLGSPIQALLNFQPGGNPYQGIEGGVAGLAESYGQSYSAALSANQENYNNIIAGYGTLGTNIANTLGQGGTGWGIAQPAATAISQTQAQQTGGAIQNSINAGTGNTTNAAAAQRGANLNAQQAYASLGSQLAQTYAGYQANLGQSELGFMNSVQIPYPNAAQYNQLYQQYGQQQANAANMALQQQALQMSMRSANSAQAKPGVSTPQMPTGGTFGTGGGSFPYGSAVTPTGFGGQGNAQQGSPGVMSPAAGSSGLFAGMDPYGAVGATAQADQVGMAGLNDPATQYSIANSLMSGDLSAGDGGGY